MWVKYKRTEKRTYKGNRTIQNKSIDLKKLDKIIPAGYGAVNNPEYDLHGQRDEGYHKM